MKRVSWISGIVALGMLAAGCQPKAEADPSGAIATVDGEVISHNTFNQYSKGVAGKPAEDLTTEQRDALLEELIRAQVVAVNAKAKGIDKLDETRGTLELQRLTILQRAMSQDYLKDRVPSEDELRAEYALQVADMDKVQYRASHILLPTEDAASKVIAQLQAGADFAQLARTQSTHAASAANGGDLDWFAVSTMSAPFAEAVTSLKNGEYTSKPVHTELGWHVIRLTDPRQASPPPYDSVRERLKQIVENKKMQAYVDTLVTKAKITKTP